MALKDHIIAMENRDSRYRGNYIAETLRALGLSPVFQEWQLPHVRNIIIDLPADARTRLVLFTAHYDAVKGTPAANDNASGAAVLLGLCRETKNPPAPLRIIFFDREEAWLRLPLIRLGLLGSLYYTMKNDLRNVAAVYNLEFVGRGNYVGVWPVKTSQVGLPGVRAIQRAAAALHVPVRLAHIPWLLISSDHLAFRLRGVHNAVTLSLLPSSQVTALDAFLAHLTVPRLLFRRRSPLPEPLSLIHSDRDTADTISEDSLQLALSLLREIIRDHASRGTG